MPRQSLSNRTRRFVLLLVLVCAWSGTACGYTFHVYQIGGPEHREQGNQPMTEWRRKTLHSFLWGAVRQDLPIDNCTLGDGSRTGIEEVKVSTSLAFASATIVTLGIWSPVNVAWRCARTPGPRDILNRARP